MIDKELLGVAECAMQRHEKESQARCCQRQALPLHALLPRQTLSTAPEHKGSKGSKGGKSNGKSNWHGDGQSSWQQSNKGKGGKGIRVLAFARPSGSAVANFAGDKGGPAGKGQSGKRPRDHWSNQWASEEPAPHKQRTQDSREVRSPRRS